MKKDLFELVFILDASGSMQAFVDDTVGGYNSMLQKQREIEGEAIVSTVLFNTQSRVVHDRVALGEVSEMTKKDYQTYGCTAMLDAIGDALHHIGNVHKYARDEDRPEKTIVIIITDGMENASRRYTRGRVMEMISRQREKYGWEFIFLGANIEAEDVAENIGIERERAATYEQSTEGITACFCMMSDAVVHMRQRRAEKRDEWKRK